MRLQIYENLKTASLNPQFTGYKKAYSQVLIFRTNINNFTSFAAMMDAIGSIDGGVARVGRLAAGVTILFCFFLLRPKTH